MFIKHPPADFQPLKSSKFLLCKGLGRPNGDDIPMGIRVKFDSLSK